MPKTKKKIGLTCRSIDFTDNSIIYNVESDVDLDGFFNVVCCDNISDKDLILKPTFVSKDNMRVVFTPSNVTPHFYYSIIYKKMKQKDLEEYITELDKIYLKGDTVGYVLI